MGIELVFLKPEGGVSIGKYFALIIILLGFGSFFYLSPKFVKEKGTTPESVSEGEKSDI